MANQDSAGSGTNKSVRLRKATAVFLALNLATAGILTGCSSSKTQSGGETQVEVSVKEKNPFTFDYKTDTKNIGYFTQNDSVVTLMASTPFYAGAQASPSQKTSEFDKARASKVQEIIKDADALTKTSVKVKPGLEKIRGSLLDYLTVVTKQEPKLKKSGTKEIFSQVSAAMTKEQIIESEIKSFKKTEPKGEYAKSFIDYMMVSKTVELGDTYLNDISDIGVSAALSLEAFKDSKDSKIIAANKKLDSDMKALDDLKSDQEAILNAIGKVDFGLKQLATGDYYMALAANNFMGSKIADLESKAKSIKPSENFTDKDIKFAQQYLEFFKGTQKSFDEYLKSVDKSKLVPVNKTGAQSSGLLSMSVAYAADGSDYSNAVVSMATPSNPPASSFTDYLKKGWSGIKTVAHGAQTAVGVGVDSLGVTVRNTTRWAYGKYYGESKESIASDIRNNIKEVVDNYNNNKSGSATFETAGEYLEGVEKGAGKAVEGVVEKGVGKGWTSWAAGGVIKTTVNMFTGFGKGIYKISNRNSTTGQVVEGALDVGLSFIGGSKVIIKGSQVPGLLRGLADSGKLLGTDGIQFVKTMLNNVDKSKLTAEMAELLTKSKLTQAEVETLIKASIEYETKEAVNATLKVFRADLVKQMQELVKKGGTNALASSSDVLGSSLKDLLKESFEANLGEFKRAMIKVMGETGTDYIDNLVGSWVDDFLKGAIKDYLDSAPTNEEVSGTWTGQYTITEILISADDAKAQGCDYSQLQKLVGQTKPLSLNLTIGANGTGTSSVKVGSEKSASGTPTKYIGGHVVLDRVQDGMSLHMEGDVSRTDSGYAINGPLTASMKGLKLFKGSWKVTKAGE